MRLPFKKSTNIINENVVTNEKLLGALARERGGGGGIFHSMYGMKVREAFWREINQYEKAKYQ